MLFSTIIIIITVIADYVKTFTPTLAQPQLNY